jgi:hypothetical protein
MDLTAISDLSPRNRRFLMLASLIAIPTYVLPVGFWGLRGLRPRILRDATSGAITLGFLSIAGWGLSQLIQRRAPRVAAKAPCASDKQRWKLPIQGRILPEEDDMVGSAASGH